MALWPTDLCGRMKKKSDHPSEMGPRTTETVFNPAISGTITGSGTFNSYFSACLDTVVLVIVIESDRSPQLSSDQSSVFQGQRSQRMERHIRGPSKAEKKVQRE